MAHPRQEEFASAGPKGWLLVFNHRYGFLFVIGFLGLVGCGKATGDVKGTVSYKGKILKAGTVNIRGADKVIQQGIIQENGEFFVKAVPTGQAEVSIIAHKPGMEEYMNQLAGRGKGKKGPVVAVAPNSEEQWSLIPLKYNQFETSELSIEIKSGENKQDLDLK